MDPVGFVREQLKAEPDRKQRNILNAVARGERRVSVRSGHGVGKTTTLAWLIVWFSCTRFPQNTVCTAPTSDQLFDALAKETKIWFGKLPDGLRESFEVQTERIFFKPKPEESFVSFRTSRPDKPEAMAGVHADNVLLIGDEASGIPEAVFEAGAGSMSGHNAHTVLAGNPVRSSGYFYETFHSLRSEWFTEHVSCVNHPRVSPDFVQQILLTYGERSNAYRVRVLGEFPLADEDTVIPFELVEPALTRNVKPLIVKEIWGLDVGRFGSDPSALARRLGNTLVKPVEIKQGYDTMRVAGWVKSEYDAAIQKPSSILVDVIGIGAGVLDRLVELRVPARGINVSESPTIFDEQYLNLRAELWFKGRDWFANMDCSISGDGGLMSELTAPKFKFSSNGKRQVESKDELKKRMPKLGSPNRADAFLLTLAEDAVTAIGGPASTNSGWKTALKRGIRGIV